MKATGRSYLFSIFASLVIAASCARATIVLSTLAEPRSSLSSIGIPWVGQRFVTGPSADWLLNNVSVDLYETQDSTSPFFVSIYSNSGDSDSPDVELGRFLTGDFPPTIGGIYTYSGYTGGLLAPSTSYWLVLGADAADVEDPTMYLWWSTSSSSYSSADSWLIPPTANSALSFLGGSWSVGSETPFMFAIDASAAAVPEPGTWATAALLAGGAGFIRWRRRQKLT